MSPSPASSTQLPHRGWCSSGGPSPWSPQASPAVCCSLSDPRPLTDNVYSNDFQFFMLMGEKSGDQMFPSVSLVRLLELPKGENTNKIYSTSAAKLPVQESHSCWLKAEFFWAIKISPNVSRKRGIFLQTGSNDCREGKGKKQLTLRLPLNFLMQRGAPAKWSV